MVLTEVHNKLAATEYTKIVLQRYDEIIPLREENKRLEEHIRGLEEEGRRTITARSIE